MRFFRENTTLKVLAVVVSVVLWAFVKISQGPGSERMQLTLRLPLEIEGRSKDVEVDAPSQVLVTLRGDRRDLDQMPPENFVRARVDVTGLGPGLYPRQVRVVPPGGLELVQVDPAQVTLSVSSKVTRTKPVQITVSGNPARGMVSGVPASDPATVQVTGPESAVDQVDHVEGEIVLNPQIHSGISLAVRDLIPVDANGRLVNRVRVERKSVIASVSVERVSAPVPVMVGADNVRFDRKPGMEYDIKLFPDKVTVLTGNTGKVPRLLLTEDLDLGEIVEPTRQEVNLRVPPEISMVSSPKITVEIVPRKATPAPSPSQSQTASPLRPSPSPNS